MTCLRYLVFLSLLARAQSLQCKNADGKPVDWFAMYKMPKIAKSEVPLVKAGLAVMYLDGSNPSWTQSSYPVNSTKQAPLYQTLAPVYSRNNDMMLIMYNDQFPNGTSKPKYGHTKGVVAFDKEGGFWLVHSVPRFPSVPEKGYKWPDVQPVYGQSFLCISFLYEALDDIGEQLFYNYPGVYVQQVPDVFQLRFPVLGRVGQGQPAPGYWTSYKSLLSRANTEFRSFAKFADFNADLYDALVAPTLRSSLLVETWRRGRSENLQDNCNAQYKVMNVDVVSINGGQGRVTFNKSVDHAKWAVSAFSREGHWVCIGDINRQGSQYSRSGGTVCFQNEDVWRTFFNSVPNYTPVYSSSRSVSSSFASLPASCSFCSCSLSSSSSFSLSFSASLFPLFVVVVQVVSL